MEFGFAACGIALIAFATWAFALDRRALWWIVKTCVADHKLIGATFPASRSISPAARSGAMWSCMVRLAGDFGMTPATRARSAAGGWREPTSKFGDLLGEQPSRLVFSAPHARPKLAISWPVGQRRILE